MADHPASYTDWSHTDLIKRINDLEHQLRQHNATTSPLSPSAPAAAAAAAKPPKFHKPPSTRTPKAFDPSKYHTRLIALKFAYLGGNYNGFEHHSNNATPLPTVEEVLWRALRKTRLIFPTTQTGGGGGVEKAAKKEEGWEATVGWHPWSGSERKEEVCWDGCEYSKCGRTDKGVSAFGQVIGIRVRSSRPKASVGSGKDMVDAQTNGDMTGAEEAFDGQTLDEASSHTDETVEEPSWDPIKDELPYIQLLNRVLPSDIRVLAWCPNPPADFSARFNCRERRYRYFFTNPAYIPLPPSAGDRAREGWLDLDAMQRAAKKLEGLHDFRNFCKIDASKQITSFERRIFSAGIHAVTEEGSQSVETEQSNGDTRVALTGRHDDAQLYFFEVRGSAFLWHQVRHMVGIIFLVGQGYEDPSVVDELLDASKNPACPTYDMASDTPLVLWDCIFPDEAETSMKDHADTSSNTGHGGYKDAMNWIYVGDKCGGRDPARITVTNVEDGKHGRKGIMEDLWAVWRKRKMDEVLAGSLMDVVARQRPSSLATDVPVDAANAAKLAALGQPSARIFDGGEEPVSLGRYIPVMQRKRKDSPEVLNARYAARKGLDPPGYPRRRNGDVQIDE